MKIINENNVEWRENGKLHRLDGPARIWWDSGKCEYWFDGELTTKEELELFVQHKINNENELFDFLMEKTLKEEIEWEVKFVENYPNALKAEFQNNTIVIYGINRSLQVNHRNTKINVSDILRLKEVIEAQFLLSLTKAMYAIS